MNNSNEQASPAEPSLAGVQRATSAQRQRLAELRARQHVGAAGWAQTSTLEGIIRAGQEGLIATDALRQVVNLTTQQLRALPLEGGNELRAEHAQALRGAVESGEAQLTAAQATEELVRQALEDVTHLPVDEVSVQRLEAIRRHVHDQVAALNTIVEAARVQAATLAQVEELERVSAEHQSRIGALRQLSSAQEVAALGEAGEQIVTRIAELDVAHPEQLDALTRIGEAVVERVSDTGAAQEEQAEALLKLAQAAQEKGEQIREEQGQEPQAIQ